MRRMTPFVCLALGCAILVQQGLGWNDFSHYAQVRALDAGTAIIDRDAHLTGDLGRFEGHFYSDKAPGLAFLTVPAYWVATALGMDASAADEIHLLVLFGCLLPLVLLLVAVARFVDRFEPDRGPLVAVLLCLGSMLLPFSTIFFAHVLTACLGFGAYYLLWRERERRDRRFLALAGALAGLAVTGEYTAGILVVLLGVYALEQRVGWLPRAAWYAGGVLVGLIPLFAYNWWAFGSPLHNSYSNVTANEVGLFGLIQPSGHATLDLLFGVRGLLTVTPLAAAAVVGLVLLHREGRRSEARLAAAVALAFLAFNVSYYLPFGGWSPGPRFLIPVLPFLALPLAVSLRRLPALTLVLAGISAAMMIAGTLAAVELPQHESTGYWWDRLADGTFGVAGGAAAAAGFLVAVALAVYLAARIAPPLSVSRRDAELGAVATVAWLVVAAAGGTLVGGFPVDSGDVALALLVAGVVGVCWLWLRHDPLVIVAGALLLPVALPAVHRHYKWSLLLVAASLTLLAWACWVESRRERGEETAWRS